MCRRVGTPSSKLQYIKHLKIYTPKRETPLENKDLEQEQKRKKEIFSFVNR